VLSVVALVKVADGRAPKGHLAVAASWFNPFSIGSFSAFVNGVLLMLFIYWGWDTAVAVNEETADATRTPGRAAVISTFLLLAIYALVIIAVQSFAGLGATGIGLGNTANQGDVLSVLGGAIFGTHGFGLFLSRLLVLMVLSSAAASTQTTILPTARTTLSMAVYGAIPKAFARVHRRFLTPTVSTVVMCAISIALYATMNYISSGSVIADSVSALGIMIAFYYGLTGFACFWYYRKKGFSSARNLVMQGILPLLGGLILWAAMGYNFWFYWRTINSYTTFQLPFWPHWDMGGVFVIEFLTIFAGVLFFLGCLAALRPYFRGDTLRSGTLVPDVDVLAGPPPAVPEPTA
jgi:amino acid transporter